MTLAGQASDHLLMPQAARLEVLWQSRTYPRSVSSGRVKLGLGLLHELRLAALEYGRCTSIKLPSRTAVPLLVLSSKQEEGVALSISISAVSWGVGLCMLPWPPSTPGEECNLP